jgi:superoxide dismutase
VGRPLGRAGAGNLEILPEDIRTAVRNNAGGHANHTLVLGDHEPDGGGEPSGSLQLRSTTPSTASTR